MSKRYLTSFTLPLDKEETIWKQIYDRNGGYVDNQYPIGLFRQKQAERFEFAPITIFYGGNGSGKSTLLNLIGQKLQLKRIAPFNSSEIFDLYVQNCRFSLGEDEEGFPYRVPNGSRLIASDEIFDYMLTARDNNEQLQEDKQEVKNEYAAIKFGKTVKFQSMADYEALRVQVLSRKKAVSRRQFIRKIVGEEVKLNSNGETALAYFYSRLQSDTLYCLDEPENSLSPRLQQELVAFLEETVRFCGSQFIIATHSPFLLAMEGVKIYNLDEVPVCERHWWELENPKAYFSFFYKHKDKFLS